MFDLLEKVSRPLAESASSRHYSTSKALKEENPPDPGAARSFEAKWKPQS